jgi:hypothetical protein
LPAARVWTVDAIAPPMAGECWRAEGGPIAPDSHCLVFIN